MAEKIFDTHLRIGGPSGPLVASGSGSPEGVLTAPVGSRYLRTDGVGGTVEYRKETGTGNTGWVSGQKITVGTTAPSSPAVGDIWIDTN